MNRPKHAPLGLPRRAARYAAVPPAAATLGFALVVAALHLASPGVSSVPSRSGPIPLAASVPNPGACRAVTARFPSLAYNVSFSVGSTAGVQAKMFWRFCASASFVLWIDR